MLHPTLHPEVRLHPRTAGRIASGAGVATAVLIANAFNNEEAHLGADLADGGDVSRGEDDRVFIPNN